MKKLLTILLALLMVFSLAACSSGGSEGSEGGESEPTEEKAKIGVVVPNLNNAFCVEMDKGIKRAAAEHGYEVYNFNTEIDPEKDISSVELLADNGVKAYYAIHMAGEAVGELLKNQYPDMACFSQTQFDGAKQVLDDDFDYVGDQFCEALDAFLEERGITEAEIVGLFLANCQIEGTSESIQEQKVMKKIHEHYDGTGIQFVQSVYPTGDEESGNAVETLMLAHPNAKIFFTHNNGTAITAANIIRAAVTDTSDYFVFSTEGDEETYNQIADPESPYRAASVADTEGTGYLIGLECVNWIENGVMNGVSTARQLVDWRNVEDFR